MKNKIKKVFDKLFYQNFINAYNETMKESNFKKYLLKFVITFIVATITMYLIFPTIIYSLIVGFFITLFYVNEIYLNNIKIKYNNYILNQLSIYTNQMSLLLTFNNVYKSLNDVSKYLSDPLKTDILEVIKNIEKGDSISESFFKFDEKYNNRTVKLFNQTLEIFDKHGDRDSEEVLHNISEELNMIKVQKDKFLRYKKEWRTNFYVVLFLCMSMPFILKTMIPTIYFEFMKGFGNYVLSIIIIINLLVIKKVENIYRDQNIGEGGN